MNFVDTYQRKGLYPAPKFPFQLGQEGAGTIVALPTDPKVLEDEDYKANGLTLGTRVFVVSWDFTCKKDVILFFMGFLSLFV